MQTDFTTSILDYLNSTKKSDTYHNILWITMQNIDKLDKLTINQLADLCYVSAPTITRLSHFFGCQNYSEFKQNIKELGNSIEFSHFHINKTNYKLLSSTPKQYLENYTDSITNALIDASKDMDLRQIDQFLHRLYQTENVYFFSYSTSYHNASLLQADLMTNHKVCICPHTIEQQKQAANELTENDLAIVISCYGNMLNRFEGLINDITRSKAYTVLITQNSTTLNAALFDEILSFTKNNHIEAGPYIMNYGFEYLGRRYHALFKNNHS